MHRYDSFCYPQSGFLVLGKEIALSKVGRIRMKMHRPIEGEVKTCTIKKTASGAWDVTLSCEVRTTPLEPLAEAIAIDVGLESFATLSNGEKIANPRFFKKGEKALAKAQRKLSKQQKDTKERPRQGRLWLKSMNGSRTREGTFVTSNLEKLSININISA